MQIIESTKVDAAAQAAESRNPNSVCYEADVYNSDGTNPSDDIDNAFTTAWLAYKRNSNLFPKTIYKSWTADGSGVYYFIGDEQEVINKLNAIK